MEEGEGGASSANGDTSASEAGWSVHLLTYARLALALQVNTKMYV